MIWLKRFSRLAIAVGVTVLIATPAVIMVLSSRYLHATPQRWEAAKITLLMLGTGALTITFAAATIAWLYHFLRHDYQLRLPKLSQRFRRQTS